MNYHTMDVCFFDGKIVRSMNYVITIQLLMKKSFTM